MGAKTKAEKNKKILIIVGVAFLALYIVLFNLPKKKHINKVNNNIIDSGITKSTILRDDKQRYIAEKEKELKSLKTSVHTNFEALKKENATTKEELENIKQQKSKKEVKKIDIHKKNKRSSDEFGIF